MGYTIFHEGKGAREESDYFLLGICQVAGVKVAGCHIGLELLMSIKVGTRSDARREEPAPQFSHPHGRHMASEFLPNC